MFELQLLFYFCLWFEEICLSFLQETISANNLAKVVLGNWSTLHRQTGEVGFILYIYLCDITAKILREKPPPPHWTGWGKWQFSHIVSVFTTTDGEHPIQNWGKKLFLLSAIVLGLNSCLHFTAFRNILKVKSCADENKKKVILKCSTFKELLPCSYCSTTELFVFARFSDSVSL